MDNASTFFEVGALQGKGLLKGPPMGGTDPGTREKIKAYPASRGIFLPYPASRRMLAFCIVFTKK